MKVTYISVYKFFIYLIIFVNLGFLSFNKDTIGGSLFKTSIISLFLFIIYLFQRNKANVNFKIEDLIIFCFFCYIIFQMIRILTGNIINIDFVTAFKSNLMYLLLLLIFPIKEIMYYDGYGKFLHTVFKLGICASLLRFLVYFFYNYFGIVLMQGIIDERGLDWVRNGTLRLTATFLDGFVFCYALYLFFRKKQNKYLLIVLYELLYAVLVYQSRSQIICFIVTFIVMFLFKNKNFIKAFFNVLIISIVIILILRSPFFSHFIQSFYTTNVQNGSGTQIRIDSLNFYMQQWLQFSIPFGLGLVSDGTSILTFSLGIHQVYLSDLGILGTLFRLGIVGFIIWIFPMMYGIGRGLKNIFKNPIALLSLGLTTYIILSSIMSQNVYDSVRISILPLWIIIIFLSGSKSIIE